ncbi:uncharacterized protein LOC131853646 [Achroia grisella]|uniref:uncharacterized protein LOC131853646 n=1 Tax=Achroia grisella TaxID=688607 RepID=UPI0027D21267|nr:uncharacterized protein LOC131853646 [Achroia grisella]
MEARLSILYLLTILFNKAHTDPRIDTVRTTSSKIIKLQDPPLHRGLKAGDILTPYELLPITKKLIDKVEEPGRGKGIVSSAISPEDLADKLFKSFFFTEGRIVKLQEFDISGLDALQALALSGEVVNLRNSYGVINEKISTISYRGQNIILDQKPKTCQYTLITKPVEDNMKIERRGIELAKKLAKKRRLVVNSNRRHIKLNNKRKKERVKVTTTRYMKIKKNKSSKILQKKDGPTTKKHVNKRNKTGKSVKEKKDEVTECRWQYKCSNPANLDTCRLNTKCTKKESLKTTPEFISIQHKPDEHSLAIKQFRKMFGISMVDEEVEKIVESRMLYLKPQNINNSSERLESLKEYFEKVIMSEFIQGSTTPMSHIQNMNRRK